MKNHENTAAAIVAHWERRAKAELHIESLLHSQAKRWLVDAIVTALAEASTNIQEPIKTGRKRGAKDEQL
jgi:hypothetical protein